MLQSSKKLIIGVLLCASIASYAKEVENNISSSQASIAQEDSLLATVNGKEIRKSFFDIGFHKADLKMQQKLLKRVIASELLVEYAEKQPLYRSKKVLDAVEKIAQKRIENRRKFTDLDKRMVHGLYVVNLEATEYADSVVTDEMIKRYYEKRKRNFKRMSYRRIYTLSLPNRKLAQEEIATLNKAENKKNAFIALIKKYNLPSLKEQLSSTKKIYKFGSTSNPFNQAMFLLKTGEYTKKPIEEEGRYTLIYCIEKAKSKTVPSLEELRSNISNILHYREANDWLSKKVKMLKIDAKIENYLEK